MARVVKTSDGAQFDPATARDLASLNRIENAIGSAFDDQLFGDGNDNDLSGGSGDDLLSGRSGDDTLHGGDGQDTLIGGLGDDTLYGGTGSDVYIVGLNDSHDTLEDVGNALDVDRLEIGASYSSSFAVRWNEDLRIELPNGSVLVRGQFSAADSNGIEIVEFDDAVITDISGLAQLALAQTAWMSGSSGDDVVTGTSQSDVIIGKAGNDQLRGGAGSDFYIYGVGDGTDTIDESSSSITDIDSLFFRDLELSAVTLERSGQHLRISINATAETLTITDQFVSSTRGVERIQFANNLVLDRAAIDLAAMPYFEGTATSEQITGSTDHDRIYALGGHDTVSGLQGNDILVGGLGNDVLIGGAGNDTYVYARGDGDDDINESGNFAGSSDRLTLVDIASGDVSLQRTGLTAILTISESSFGAGDGGRITLLSGLDTPYQRGVESVHFSDGVTWTASQMRLMLLAAASTSGNDTIVGFDSADVLTGQAGDDTITALDGSDTLTGGTGNDALTGGRGNDTYTYARGDGDDVIDESTAFHGESDRLTLLGITADQVSLERNGNDATLVIAESASGAGDGGRITLRSQLDPSYQRGVESIAFADGTTWSQSQMRLMVRCSVNLWG